MKTPARSHLVLPRQMDTFGEKRLFRNGRSKQASKKDGDDGLDVDGLGNEKIHTIQLGL